MNRHRSHHVFRVQAPRQARDATPLDSPARAMATEHAKRMEAWQAANGCKVADVPEGSEKPLTEHYA